MPNESKSSETAMEIGGVYLVVLHSGLAFFGELDARIYGICRIGGFYAMFHVGMFAEEAIKRVVHFGKPLPGETEAEWAQRVEFNIKDWRGRPWQ